MSKRLSAPGFALLVIGLDGEEEYLCDGMSDRPSCFFNRREAQSEKDFLWIGMEGDVQSINIVPYPRRVTASKEPSDGDKADGK